MHIYVHVCISIHIYRSSCFPPFGVARVDARTYIYIYIYKYICVRIRFACLLSCRKAHARLFTFARLFHKESGRLITGVCGGVSRNVCFVLPGFGLARSLNAWRAACLETLGRQAESPSPCLEVPTCLMKRKPPRQQKPIEVDDARGQNMSNVLYEQGGARPVSVYCGGAQLTRCSKDGPAQPAAGAAAVKVRGQRFCARSECM